MSAVSERSRGPVVVALARTEGRKLITHPVFLVGVGIALVGCASFVQAIATRPRSPGEKTVGRRPSGSCCSGS